MAEALIRSHEHDSIEKECKQLFLRLFNEHVKATFDDATAVAVPWLGSDSLALESSIYDALMMLSVNVRPDVLRVLLKEYRSQSGYQKRGLKFLRFYLEMLYPGECSVKQLYLDSAHPYPTPVEYVNTGYSWWLFQVNEPGITLNGRAKINNQDESLRSERQMSTSTGYLSSRVRVEMSLNAGSSDAEKIKQIIKTLVPARITPELQLWSAVRITWPRWQIRFAFNEQRAYQIPYPYNSPVVTNDHSRWFSVTPAGEEQLRGQLVKTTITRIA